MCAQSWMAKLHQVEGKCSRVLLSKAHCARRHCWDFSVRTLLLLLLLALFVLADLLMNIKCIYDVRVCTCCKRCRLMPRMPRAHTTKSHCATTGQAKQASKVLQPNNQAAWCARPFNPTPVRCHGTWKIHQQSPQVCVFVYVWLCA